MTDKQFDLMEYFDMKVSDVRVSKGVCELILNETQKERPTERETLAAYNAVRILAKSLFDRLRIESKDLQWLHDELEKELQG